MNNGWLVLGLCLLGCGSSAEETTTGGEGGTGATGGGGMATGGDGGTATGGMAANGGGGTGGSGGGPEACNDLVNAGEVIPQTFVATDPVTGNGGVVASGTYTLTAAVAYSGTDGQAGPTGVTFQDTVDLDAAIGEYQRVASIIGGGGDGTPLHQNGTFTVNGSSIEIEQTCPVGAQPFTSYDANPTTLRIYAPSAGPGNPALMFEYTKQ